MFNYRSLFLSAAVAFAGTAALSSAEPVTVAERYFTGIDVESNVDSLAVWQNEQGQERWLIGTSKAAHKLFVYDAQNGFPLSVISEPGPALGQLQRPNGIAVFGDFAFVVERDNHRVQVFSLPAFKSLGSFGEESLIKPYGIYLRSNEDGTVDAYVSDDYNTAPGGKPEPNPDGIRERVKRFTVNLDGSELTAQLTSSFGPHSGEGALDVVESLMGDQVYDRLMIADEDEEKGLEIHVYDLDGNDSGKRLGKGLFQFQPEGIALWEQSGNGGYWIFTDQGKQSNFYHLFERESLAYVGTFQGERTLNTDGVAIDINASTAYPRGLFYAIHDDSAVSVWSLEDIARALQLD